LDFVKITRGEDNNECVPITFESIIKMKDPAGCFEIFDYKKGNFILSGNESNKLGLTVADQGKMKFAYDIEPPLNWLG
jgi:hypothetical protein